jgi:hypothetical protein
MPQNPAAHHRVKRPFGWVILLVMVGCVLISALFAFLDVRYFYAIILYSMLIGMSGGIFSWVIFEEKNQQATPIAAIGGALISLIIFCLYRYLAYRFHLNDLDLSLSFWEYTQHIAEHGVTIIRRGAQTGGIHLGTVLTWGLWLLEIVIATLTGGVIAKRMDVNIEG